MSMASVQDELKTLLRGLLISSPHAMTVDQLWRDYRKQEGHDVPFRKLGYNTFEEYLNSVPDTVLIVPSFRGGSPTVVPVASKKSSHVDALVQKQKINPPNRGNYCKPLFRRSSVKLPPETNIGNCINNNDLKQKILVPHSLQQTVYKMVLENPKGVPVQTIEQEFCCTQTLQNYGMCDGLDVYQLLNCLGHLLEVSKGMVYPLQKSEPVYRPILRESVIDCQKSNSSNSGTCHFVPAGYKIYNDFHSERNYALEEDNEQEWKVNNEGDTSISEAVCGQLDASDVLCSTKEKTEEEVKVISNSRSSTPNIGSYSDAYTSDIVSERMKTNFQILLDKHPDGILCSELQHLYKEEFKIVLDYIGLGFLSMIQMASNLPDVFHCVILDGTNWKLFDARKELPPQYSYDIKSNKIVSTIMEPTVPSKVQKNIGKLLMKNSSGIPSNEFLNKYKEMFLTSINVQELGFDTLESFLLSLSDTVLQLRYINKTIFVCALVQDPEPESFNPLPHIAEQPDLFTDLYPCEVIGPEGMLPYEEIPPEVVPGGYLEVLVAEIYTPKNFWIQLRGEKTHLALNKLMDDIQKFYKQKAEKYRMPDVTVRIGQYCMAPYSEEWHRACITAVHNLTHVQVLFVDYGTSGKVERSKLLFMHLDFTKFPIQGINASLANVIPADGAKRWLRKVSSRFLELVSDKDLIAFVCSVDHEARKLQVALVDTSGSEDVHINDVLVNEGLAEYETNRRPSTAPPTPPQRIDAVTVSHPPPGFPVGSQLHTQLLPTQSTAVSQKQVSSLPDVRLNANASNFIPQSTNVPVASPMYDISMLTNTNLLAQASLLQQFSFYDLYVQQHHLMASLLMSNPAMAYLTLPHLTALANQFGVLSLNPAVMYTPTPIAGRMANAGQLGMNISEVSPTSSQSSPNNILEQTSPPIIDKPSVSTKLLTADPVDTPAASDTSTKECSSAVSHDVCYVHVNDKISPQMCAAIHCNSQATLGTIEPQKEVTVVSQVSNEEEQNKYVIVGEDSNNTVNTEVSSNSYKVDSVQETPYEMESDPDIIVERNCVNEDGGTNLNVSDDLDSIYRSEDEIEDDEQELQCVLEPHYVKKIEIAGKMVHLINVFETAFLVTEEVVRLFTDFSGRHVILKILDAKHVVIPFREISWRDQPVIIEALEDFNIVGVPNSVNRYIHSKVHLIPLRSVPHLLTVLNLVNEDIICAVQEELLKFDPNDIYWTGNRNAAG